MSEAKTTLAAIEADVRYLQSQLEEVDDEQLEEILLRLLDSRQQKVDSIYMFLKKLDGDELFAKELFAAAKARLDRVRRLRETTKSYFLHLMQKGVIPNRLDGQVYSIRQQRNSVPTVEVADVAPVASWPERFQKVSIEADTKAIAEAFKAEEPLPDGVSVAYGSHLRLGNAK